MSNPIRTITFISVAMLCVIGAFWSMPTLGELEEGDPTGQSLFPEFTNPLAVMSMSITRYNEKTGPIPLKVELEDGVWRIPSHGNYPADALEQVAQAATLLSGMKIIGLASNESGSQEVYGVINPTQKNLGLGMKGVGTRVVLKNVEGTKLADLIIGKPDPNKPDVRYVRRTDEPMTLVVKMNVNEFTTKFSDWAEKNPLDMNLLDLRKIFIEEYRCAENLIRPIQAGRIFVQYDPTAEGDKWKLAGNWIFGRTRMPIPYPLPPDQVLNANLLDQMKSTLGDLKIIDVVPKPPSLRKKFAESVPVSVKSQVDKSMERHGFFLRKNGSYTSLYASKGEVSILLEGGVEYVLWFGGVAAHIKAAASAEVDKKDTDAPGLSRYLLVTARFNPEGIAPPELQELPALPVVMSEEETAVPEATKSNLEKIKAERALIKRENERNQREYDEKVAAGKKRAKELNARFADWYYVISENVYKKLHLTQDELFKNKSKKKQPKANQAQ